MNAAILTAFLGWCTVINLGILILSTAALYLGHRRIAPLHARMFGVEEATLPLFYFQYLALYKLITLTLNLTPYIAMRLVATS